MCSKRLVGEVPMIFFYCQSHILGAQRNNSSLQQHKMSIAQFHHSPDESIISNHRSKDPSSHQHQKRRYGHAGRRNALTTLPRATALRKVEVRLLDDDELSSMSSSARTADACRIASESWTSSSIASMLQNLIRWPARREVRPIERSMLTPAD